MRASAARRRAQNPWKRRKPAGPRGDSAPAAGDIVADSEWLGLHVRVIRDEGKFDQYIGTQGTVQAVNLRNGEPRALVVTDGDKQGKGVFYIRTSTENLVKTIDDNGKTPPIAAVDHHRALSTEEAQTFLKQLNCFENQSHLESVVPGQMIELQTVSAGLLEIQRRFDNPEVVFFNPAECIGLLREPAAPDEAGFAQEQVDLRNIVARMGGARLLCAVIHSAGHYTAVTAQRDSLTSPWGVPEHSDSLANVDALKALSSGRAASTNLCAHLGLPAPVHLTPQPHQEDGWSCGLWAMRFIEEQLRESRGEPEEICPSTIPLCLTRVNKFIAAVKAAATPPAGGAPEAAAAMILPSGQIRRLHSEMPVGPATSMDEALMRATMCPCRPRASDGFKGCAREKCMGQWFELHRLKKRFKPEKIPAS